MSVEQMLREGVEAAQSGKTLRARTLLSKVVLEMPASVDAWWWLGQSVQDPKQREYCFRKVVEIDPSHDGARAELGMSPAPLTAERRRSAPRAKSQRRRGLSRAGQRVIIVLLLLGVILIAIGGGGYVALDSLGYLDDALRGDFSFLGSVVPEINDSTPTPDDRPPTATFESVSLASIPTWTPTVSLTPRPATPTPTITPPQRPQGTATPVPPTPDNLPLIGDAEVVQSASGTGVLSLFPNEFEIFRFVPELVFDLQTVGSMTFHTIGDLSAPLSVELYVWNWAESSWSVFGVIPGDMVVAPASAFVDSGGVIVATLRNWGTEPINILNAGFTFNGWLTNGAEITYGLMRQEIRPTATATST